MIYFFKGIGAVVSAPFQLCGFCTKQFGDVCHKSCKCCSDMMERPLCFFVWLSFLFGAASAYYSVMAFRTGELGSDIEVTNTTSTVVITNGTELVADASASVAPLVVIVCEHPVKLLLMANMVFAVMHVSMAFYMQSVVWERVRVTIDEYVPSGYELRTQGLVEIILESFTYVFCRDVLFCLYVFFLAGTFAANYMGRGWTSGNELPGCNPGGYPQDCFKVGVWFPWAVVGLGFAWLMGLSCNTALDQCCAPCGGFKCCFGQKPPPRSAREQAEAARGGCCGGDGSGDSSSSDSESGGREPVQGKLLR